MIDTKALRSKVLDFAIQGKLTEQIESDGTAEELFAQIQEEKQKLIKEGKIKKEKALPPIKDDEIPFDIPSNWKWCKTNQCILPMETRKPSGESFVYIDIEAINNKKQCIEDVKTIETKNAPSRASRAVFENSVLFSLVRPYLRNIARVTNKYSNGIASTGFYILTSNGMLNPGYLYILMISDYSVNGLNEFMKGNNSPSIKTVHVEQWLLPIPPLAEQKRIVERVEEIFKLLDIIDEAQKKYSADAEILKSKLITMGIQGKLTKQLDSDGTAEELYKQIQEEKQKLIKEGKIKKEKVLQPVSDEEIPFEIPKNWKWVKVANIGITVTGSTPSKKNPEYYGGNYPFFKPSDLDKGNYIDIASEYLSDLGKNASRQLTKGTILVSCIGNLGKCAVINIDGTTNQQINALTPIKCDTDYLLFVICSNMFKAQLEYVSAATTLAIVNKTKFDNCIIPLPPLAEQKRIADTLDGILRVIG